MLASCDDDDEKDGDDDDETECCSGGVDDTRVVVTPLETEASLMTATSAASGDDGVSICSGGVVSDITMCGGDSVSPTET